MKMKKSWGWLVFLAALVGVSAGWAQEFPGKLRYDMALKNMQMQMNMMQLFGHDSVDQLSEEWVMAPSLLGTWKGSAPWINLSGVCSSYTVTLTIAKQCPNFTNLFKGIVKVGTFANIPVLGRYYLVGTTGYILLWGQVTSFPAQIITLVGSYSATTPPKIKVIEFYYYNQTTLGNQEFDLFTLVKQ